ncbi:hypothetical protein QBC41DRAFT_45375 [Cercophora samala]|uniref:Uncharacterized protein n=1 Tax=Cercophora samala TaxID=330535 RepID=A0AA39ZIN8_9PEZI|nr:hypothetical protein QBC41DRAFT_45375 [Cercophora samala]
MGPSPATPAPSRFLLSKRPGTHQPHGQTPNQSSSAAPHRFYSTPKFSSTAKPLSHLSHAAPYSTPALALKAKASRARYTQDLLIEDSSPVSDHERSRHDEEDLSPSRTTTFRDFLPESIDIDSSLVPQSSLPVPEDHDEDVDPGPLPKRRRISITTSEPDIEPKEEWIPSSAFPIDSDSENEIRPHDDPEIDHIITVYSDDEDNPPIPHSSPLDIKSDAGSDSEAKPPPDKENKPARKEIFNPAPRFLQPPSPPPSTSPVSDSKKFSIQNINPDLFSPPKPRRGRNRQSQGQYLTNGLAAELQNWLIEVKGTSERTDASVKQEADAPQPIPPGAVQLTVADVKKGGEGLSLVSAAVANAPPGTPSMQAVLAGDGRIGSLDRVDHGLDRRSTDKRNGHERLAAGTVVAVAPPAWDVELGGGLGRWAVAYRWQVVKDAPQPKLQVLEQQPELPKPPPESLQEQQMTEQQQDVAEPHIKEEEERQ